MAAADALEAWLREDHHAVNLAVVDFHPGGGDDIVEVARRVGEPVVLSMQGAAGTNVAEAARTPIAVNMKKKIIVVLEYDAMSSADPTLAAAVNAAIRVNMVPVVLVGRGIKKTELPKGHAVFSRAHAAAAAAAAADDDNTRIQKTDKGVVGAKHALRGNAEEAYRGDGIALGAVFDNYLACAGPDADIVAIADAFSDADKIGEGLCRTGCYDDPFSFVPISAAALYVRTNVDDDDDIEITTFGMVWSKMNAAYAKVRSAAGVHRASGLEVVNGADFVRHMVVHCGKDAEKIAHVARAASLGPGDLLAVMRLWKVKYTLATHAKVKKLLQQQQQQQQQQDISASSR